MKQALERMEHDKTSAVRCLASRVVLRYSSFGRHITYMQTI